MTRHSIKIQKQKLDAQTIHSRKNFNTVMHRYKRTARMHRLSNLISISGTLVIILVTINFLLNLSPKRQIESKAETILIDSLPVIPGETADLLPPVPVAKVNNPRVPAKSPEVAKKKVYVNDAPEIALESSVPDAGSSLDIAPQAINSQQIKKFLSGYSEAPQSFTINPAKDTVLRGRQGTEVIIPANSMVAGNSIPVKRNITIKLEEFYTIPDMIFASLSTTSNGKMLETGGMINILALAEDEPLQLKDGREITLKFPYTGQAKEMQLFTGKATTDGTMNWLLSEIEPYQQEPVFLVAEQSPVPVGGMNVFYEYIGKNLKFPDEVSEKVIQGKVFISFVVDIDSSLTDIMIIKGIGKEYDEEALRVIRNSPVKWIPGKQRGKPVKVRMSIPVAFKLDGNKEGNKQTLITSPTSSKDNTLPVLGNTKASSGGNDSYYTLTSNRLGWINCDRFVAFKGPKTNLVVPASIENQMSTLLIFKDYKSILPPNRCIDGNFIFNNIPLNEKVIILGIKLVDNVPFLAIQEIKPEQVPEQELTLHFEKATRQDLSVRLKETLR